MTTRLKDCQTINVNAQTTAKGSNRRSKAMTCAVAFAGLLLFTAIHYRWARLPASADEIKCSLSTIDFLKEEGRPTIFLYSNGYMAPLEPLLAYCLTFLSLGKLASLRVANYILLLLSVIVWVRLLTRRFGITFGFSLAALYMFPAPQASFTRFITPGYAGGHAAIALYLYIVFTKLPSAIMFGLCSGILYYIFPVASPIIATCAFAFPLSSEHTWKPPLKTIYCHIKNTPLISLAIVATGITIAGCCYYYLTRPHLPLTPTFVVVFLPTSLIFLWACKKLMIDFYGAARMRSILEWQAKHWLAFCVIAAATKAAFIYFDRPLYIARGVAAWQGDSYALRNITEWPRQLILLLGRAVPLVINPFADQNATLLYDASTIPREYYLFAVGFVLFWIGLIVSAGPRLNSIPEKLPIDLVRFCCIVMSLILAPSWRLFGDGSHRYLVPYLPSLLWLLAVLVETNKFGRPLLTISALLMALLNLSAGFYQPLDAFVK